jgi:copper chaperone NosL
LGPIFKTRKEFLYPSKFENLKIEEYNTKKIRNTLIFLGLLLGSCQVSERPIEYGADECEYCKMMIMDQRYGSELVTEKGKVYTFDAAECLIEYLQYHAEMADAAKYLLVTPYTDPNHLIDARTATYLVSQQMPSPMGAYLTAFTNREEAAAFQSTKGGVLYSWEEIFKDFKSIRLKAIEEFE